MSSSERAHWCGIILGCDGPWRFLTDPADPYGAVAVSQRLCLSILETTSGVDVFLSHRTRLSRIGLIIWGEWIPHDRDMDARIAAIAQAAQEAIRP